MTTQVDQYITPYVTNNMPHAQEFMEAIEREVMFSGSFGAGKTRAGCEKGYFLSMKYPGNRGLIIRKQFTALRHTTMDSWFREVRPNSASYGYNQETHIDRLKNGSEVIFLGLNDDPSRVGSLQVGWIFMDEAIEFTEADYMMLLGRLRLNRVPFRQLFMATNPGSPQHFLYKRFVLDRDPTRKVVYANSLNNPNNPDDYIQSLAAFKGIYRERFVLGKWVGFEGLVYGNADPSEVIIEPFEIPKHWPRYRGIDFGYTNPFVCQWWTRCPDDDEGKEVDGIPRAGWYLYRQLYCSQRTVNTHAALINGFKEPIADTICDWDAEDRATLDEAGVYTSIANKDIGPGVQTCWSMFENKRIHIFHDSLLFEDAYLEAQHLPVNTQQELPNYRWPALKESERDNRNPKEVPVDKDNHGMDAMRYVLHTVDGQPANAPTMVTYKPSRFEARNWVASTTVKHRRYRDI